MNTVSLSLKKVSRAVLWSHPKDSIAVKAGRLMVVSENILRLTTIKETLCMSLCNKLYNKHSRALPNSSFYFTIHSLKNKIKTLFTWSGGPRSSGVSFFGFVSPRAWKQKKPTPLDRCPPLHVNKALRQKNRRKMQNYRKLSKNDNLKHNKWLRKRAKIGGKLYLKDLYGNNSGYN